MYLKSVTLDPARYPVHDRYPFHLDIFQEGKTIEFHRPVTFFLGENGTGKSTLLKAICQRCNIHIWKYDERTRVDLNPYEEMLYRAVEVVWSDGPVPGAFFSSQTFQDFAQILDEWAAADTDVLEYFGGKSLLTQSHGQAMLSYFNSRYTRRGLYLLDEPETALSPNSQLQLLRMLHSLCRRGNAQFIIATHSPILLSCPDAEIFSFDSSSIRLVAYEDTHHYKLYRNFMNNPYDYLSAAEGPGKKDAHPRRKPLD